jgi:hypothetical protein
MPVRFSKPRLSELPVFIGLNTPIAGLEGYTKTYRLPRSGLVQRMYQKLSRWPAPWIGKRNSSLKRLSLRGAVKAAMEASIQAICGYARTHVASKRIIQSIAIANILDRQPSDMLA